LEKLGKLHGFRIDKFSKDRYTLIIKREGVCARPVDVRNPNPNKDSGNIF